MVLSMKLVAKQRSEEIFTLIYTVESFIFQKINKLLEGGKKTKTKTLQLTRAGCLFLVFRFSFKREINR